MTRTELLKKRQQIDRCRQISEGIHGELQRIDIHAVYERYTCSETKSGQLRFIPGSGCRDNNYRK